METVRKDDDQAAGDFARAAGEAGRGFCREYFDYLLHNKKWWLTPIIIALLFLGILVILSSTAVAPFIYTLF